MGNSCVRENVKEVSTTPRIRESKEIEWKDTQPFVVPIKGGRVIKVYDGDTITVANYLPYKGSPLYRFSVRLNGIDTPEIKGKNENEKKLAVIARDTLRDKILNHDVELRAVQSEKYGRVLATVYFKNENINQWMIDQHFAVEYDGGTKKVPDNWMKYYNDKKTGHLKVNTYINCTL